MLGSVLKGIHAQTALIFELVRQQGQHFHNGTWGQSMHTLSLLLNN